MGASHNWKGEEVLARIRKNVERSIATSAIILQTETKNQLNKGASPPPSAPGSPPHKLTGQLGQSIQTDLRGIREKNPRVRVGPTLLRVPYARIQELGGTISHPGGTPYWVSDEGAHFISKAKAHQLLAKGIEVKLTKPHTITLPARPYLKPAAQLARPQILKQFTSKKLLAEV